MLLSIVATQKKAIPCSSPACKKGFHYFKPRLIFNQSSCPSSKVVTKINFALRFQIRLKIQKINCNIYIIMCQHISLEILYVKG